MRCIYENNNVLFFRNRNNKKIAKEIAQKLNTDIFEIEPLELYTKEDLDWTNKNSRSSMEMRNDKSRPRIKNKIENIEEYNKVILGFPIWWYKAPTIINAFIEENNLENKEIYVFVTSGGSGITDTFNNLKKDYPNLNFIKGKRLETSEIDWV